MRGQKVSWAAGADYAAHLPVLRGDSRDEDGDPLLRDGVCRKDLIQFPRPDDALLLRLQAGYNGSSI